MLSGSFSPHASVLKAELCAQPIARHHDNWLSCDGGRNHTLNPPEGEPSKHQRPPHVSELAESTACERACSLLREIQQSATSRRRAHVGVEAPCTCNSTGVCTVFGGGSHLDGLGHVVQIAINDIAEELAHGRIDTFSGLFQSSTTRMAVYAVDAARGRSLYCHGREYVGLGKKVPQAKLLANFLCNRGPDFDRWFNLQPLVARSGPAPSHCLHAALSPNSVARRHGVSSATAGVGGGISGEPDAAVRVAAWKHTLRHVQQLYSHHDAEKPARRPLPRPTCVPPGHALLAVHLRLGDMLNAKQSLKDHLRVISQRLNSTVVNFVLATTLARRTVARFSALTRDTHGEPRRRIGASRGTHMVGGASSRTRGADSGELC